MGSADYSSPPRHVWRLTSRDGRYNDLGQLLRTSSAGRLEEADRASSFYLINRTVTESGDYSLPSRCVWRLKTRPGISPWCPHERSAGSSCFGLLSEAGLDTEPDSSGDAANKNGDGGFQPIA